KEIARFSRRLVTITRISEQQKNLSGMIEVMDLMPKGYTLDIYGGGTSEEVRYLEEMIKERSNSNVRFCGVARDVESVLKEYSVFLMTSHYEGFGQTIIEARSQGLPVIAYNTFDAASWVIKNGETGFLIQPYDKYSFKKAIL